MPLGSFGSPLGSSASLPDVLDALARLQKEVTYLLNGGLDTLNVNELSADVINAGVLNALLVSVKAALTGATITIDGNGIKAVYASGTTITMDQNGLNIFNGTKNTLSADPSGNISTEDGTITGGTVRTGASGARIELSSNSIKTYNSSDQLNGFQNGLTPSGTTYGDSFFYSDDVEALRFYNTVSDGFSIYPVNGYSLRIGAAGANVYANGAWAFSNGYTGSFQVVTDVVGGVATKKTITVSGGIITSVT